MKLLNHNAWTNGTFLDIDSLGAGGSRYHLVIANTQKQLGHLMTNSQLWDLIDSIGNYEYANGLQRDDEIPELMEEYKRLADNEKAKVDRSFMDSFLSAYSFGTIVTGAEDLTK
jgi:hypothetical protein